MLSSRQQNPKEDRQDLGRKTLYLTANQKYYQGSPLLGRFELHTYEGNKQLLRALKTSEVAAISDADVSDEELDPSIYNTDYYDINNGVYLLFNAKNATLKDKDVRLALRAAIDTDKLRNAAKNDVKQLHLPFISSQVDNKDLPKQLTHGNKVLIDDGKLRLEVCETTDTDILCKIQAVQCTLGT